MKAVVEFEINDAFADGFLGSSPDNEPTDLVNTIVLGGLDEFGLGNESAVSYKITKVDR